MRKYLIMLLLLLLCLLPAISLSAEKLDPYALQFGDQLTLTGISPAEDGEYWYSFEFPSGATGYIRSDSILTEPMTESATYIGNKNSKKFHRPTCKNLPSSENAVYLNSREEAIELGYTPCGNCQP